MRNGRRTLRLPAGGRSTRRAPVAPVTMSPIANVVRARHVWGMGTALRLLCICLTALALWCAGMGGHGAQGSAAQAMDGVQPAAHGATAQGPAHHASGPSSHAARHPADAHHGGAHDGGAHDGPHEGGHDAGAQVHAVCAAMAGHCLFGLPDGPAAARAASLVPVDWAPARSVPADGLRPEAQTPPPRA